MSPRRLITVDEATPAEHQHRAPCSDCPWARTALQGWLGGATVLQWVAMVTSDHPIECHVNLGAQCAGSAIYRSNVGKRPRDPSVLRLPADHALVFSDHGEFASHHGPHQPTEVSPVSTMFLDLSNPGTPQVMRVKVACPSCSHPTILEEVELGETYEETGMECELCGDSINVSIRSELEYAISAKTPRRPQTKGSRKNVRALARGRKPKVKK